MCTCTYIVRIVACFVTAVIIFALNINMINYDEIYVYIYMYKIHTYTQSVTINHNLLNTKIITTAAKQTQRSVLHTSSSLSGREISLL